MIARTLAQRFERYRSNAAAPYVGAVAIRTAARAIWGVALPAALSVSAYGRYQLIVTAGAMAAQIALLGTPQTVVRYAGRRLPTGRIGLHVAALAAIAIAVAVALVPTLRTSRAAMALASLILATIVATLLGARAKASFAFTRSLIAEASGAVVLVVGTAIATTAIWYRGAMSPTTAILIESGALAVTAAVLLPRATKSRESADQSASPAPRAVFANIYAVGALALLDVVLFRRLEVYFLERSPDGLAGIAVLGLSLQIATVALLIPTALLEAWQPRFALLAAGSDRSLAAEVERRGRQFAALMTGIVFVGVLVPVVAVPIVFPQYRDWLPYIVGFVAIRLVCSSAGFYSSVIYAVGSQRALFAPAALAIVVAITANAVLTRPLGLRGALIAYALTQTTTALLTVFAFRRAATRARAIPPGVVAA